MKRMTKLLAICLTSVMILTACGSSGQESSENAGTVTEDAVDNTVSAEDSSLVVETETPQPNVEESQEVEDTLEDDKEEAKEDVEEVKAMEDDIVSNLDPNKPMIALTFDDGPNIITTPQVLDLLEEYEITATFFLIGNNINASSATVVERAYNMGCEIGNHSRTHSDMTKLTDEDIISEIEYTSTKIEEITGEAPKFFRPPFISVNNNMYDNIDLTFICGYGCNDWENSVTAEQRAEMVLKFADDGVIILMHDMVHNSQTVEALKTIIPTLLDEGYQFVTVSQLFEAKGIELSADDMNMYTVVK